MPIVIDNLGASANPDINTATDASNYPNTSWTPPTSDLIMAYVASSNAASAQVNHPTISGNGLTWVEIKFLSFSVNNRVQITLFGADASGSSAGVTTINFAAQTQQGCNASFFHATGVDLSGGVAAAFIQSPTGTGTATSGSITLGAAAGSNNRAISGWYHLANEAKTPRTNWTELDDQAGPGNTRDLETQYRSDAFETTASASWTTSSPWGGIAAELKASVAAAGSLLPGGRDRYGSGLRMERLRSGIFVPERWRDKILLPKPVLLPS